MSVNGSLGKGLEGRTSMMHDLRIRLCAFALFAITRPAIAAGPRQPAASFLRHTFTTEDGLPSNVVNDVLQTRDGFLIVGVPGGVYRFDGHRFAELNSDPPKQIMVHPRAEGPAGALWVTTTFGVSGFHTLKSIREGRLYRCITWA